VHTHTSVNLAGATIMTDHSLVSIDLAKTVFQVCRFADGNKILTKKKVSRKKLNQEIAQLNPTLPPLLSSGASQAQLDRMANSL
jgi:hypothetical protein